MSIEKSRSYKCNSCGIVILDKGFSTFSCPGCDDSQISRCKNCRDQSVSYSCSVCGYQGP